MTSLFSDLVSDAESSDYHVRTFHHADGSVTVVSGDPEPWLDNTPRDYDTVVHLVSESTHYTSLDDGDADLERVREQSESLEYLTGDWELSLTESEEREERYVIVKDRAGYREWFNLDDPDDVRVLAGYFHDMSPEEMVQTYVRDERPDILHYVHEWTVSGTSQSDWRDGYAYVLRSDMEHVGFEDPTPEDAARAYAAEFSEYRSWFAGDVYYGTHIWPTGPEFAIGESGGYFTGEQLGESETCHGFIGDDQIESIPSNFTSSPVLARESVSA